MDEYIVKPGPWAETALWDFGNRHSCRKPRRSFGVAGPSALPMSLPDLVMVWYGCGGGGGGGV